jgi:hypothetical protein
VLAATDALTPKSHAPRGTARVGRLTFPANVTLERGLSVVNIVLDTELHGDRAHTRVEHVVFDVA